MNILTRFTPNCLVPIPYQLSQLSQKSKGFSSLVSTSTTLSNTQLPKPSRRNPHISKTNGRNNNLLSTTSATYSTALDSSTKPREKEEGVVEIDVSGHQDIDIDLINHLERTSLVDFDNEEALVRLQEAIRFAETLFEVDTSGVEPLISVLENESVYLREDKAEVTSREDILRNAALTVEDYFVAPPGNIPLEPQSKVFTKS